MKYLIEKDIITAVYECNLSSIQVEGGTPLGGGAYVRAGWRDGSGTLAPPQHASRGGGSVKIKLKIKSKIK